MKTKKLTLRGVRSLLKQRFGGVIKIGKHEENGECCVHELASAAKGLEWTDHPNAVRLLDLRPLNDVDVPDELRTEWMAKLLVSYDGSRDWSKQRLTSVVRKIVIGVVNELIAELPNLPEGVRQQCRNAKTMRKCKSATYATRAYAQGLSYSENPHVVDSAMPCFFRVVEGLLVSGLSPALLEPPQACVTTLSLMSIKPKSL